MIDCPSGRIRVRTSLYEAWYGFAEKPFNLTPDPKYLYLSAKHEEAFAHLEFGRRERGGFILITGEVGAGKTTLARYFLSKLGPDTRTAVVLYPALTAVELLQTILDDLHVPARGGSLKGLIDALHRYLLESRAAGLNVVLLIDEAQDLAPEVLEQVRLISNLETDTEKLIQIVLIGQSELRDLLGRHELRQLAQRITARYHLTSLSLPDTGEYIRHRLEVAGGTGKVTFTSDALAEVHRFSAGLPRLVNLISDRALLSGFVSATRTITAPMVRVAAAEVAVPAPARSRRGRHALVSVALTVLLAVLAFAATARMARAPVRNGVLPEGAGPTPAATAVTPAPAGLRSTEASGRLDAFLRSAGRQQSFAQASARIARAWAGGSLNQTTLRTHLAQLRAIGLPAVLEMFHPSRKDTCFVALLRLDESDALVAAGDGPDEKVPVSQLDELWTHDALLAWPENDTVRSDEGRAAEWARPRLAAQGYGGDDLAAAVRRFQADAHLVSDGLLGPRTRMVLFARDPGPRPRLAAEEGTP
jgi:general secretion pathway protein A